MIKLSQIGLLVGLLMTLLSLIAGFFLMFNGFDQWAKYCFMSVPVGFMLLFVSLVSIVMFSPSQSEDN